MPVSHVPPEALKFSYDQLRDVLTVEGISFSGAFFRFFQIPNVGRTFRILSIEDGVVTIHTEDKPAP